MNAVDPSVPPAPSVAPRRTARTVAIVAAAALAGIAALVAMAPTLVSWGLFRGTIVGAIGARVNGTVTLERLQVGWSGPMAVDGLVIDDPSNGNRVSVSVGIDQGLWTLVTAGVERLDVRVGGSVRARREADGSLSIARLPKPSESPAAAVPAPAASGAPGFSLPAGIRHVAVEITKLDLEVLEASGGTYAAMRDLAGSALVDAGGMTSVRVTAKTELEGKAGAIDLKLGSPGLFAADGALAIASAGAELDLSATDAAFGAAGLGFRVPSARVSVRAPQLTGRIGVDIDVAASIDGSAPASAKGHLDIDRLLTKDGRLVVDLAAIHGSLAVADVPTAPFERFAKDTGVVLSRDLGPTLAIDARFADAAGGDLAFELRSGAVRLAASGAIDPDTRAASFRSVDADATLSPALLDALAQVSVSAPARLSLRATDVSVPAAAADGSLPLDAVRFGADLDLTLAGLRVPGPEGLVPLDVTAIRLNAKAAPVSAGVTVTATAERAGATGAEPMRIAAAVRRGGAFGANGTLRVERLPTALVRPFVPKSVPVDLARDVGATIDAIDASLADGASPAFALRVAAPFVKADVRGSVGADRSIRLDDGATVSADPLSRGLLAQLGVECDADLSAGVTIRRLEVPSIEPLDLSRVAVEAEASARPFAQPPVSIRIGGGDAARTIRVTDARVAVSSAAIGTQLSATAVLRTDLVDVDAALGAKGLGDLSRNSIERAALAVDLKARNIPTALIAQEVPAAKDALEALGAGTAEAAVSYSGSLLDGKGTASVAVGANSVVAHATLTEASLAVQANAGIELTQALLAAVAPGAPARLAGPSRVEASVDAVTMKRTVPWEFAAPDALRATVRIPSIALTGVPGVQGDPALADVALDAQVALGDRMGARGTLAAAIAARRGTAPAVAIAPLRSRFSWSAATAAAPMAWDAEATLEPVSADGIAALIDLDESMRRELGTGARIGVKASSLGADGVAFEADSTLERLKAAVNGRFAAGELSLERSSVDLTVPAAQATELANSLAAGKPGDGKQPAPAWKSVGAVAVQASVESFRMRIPGGFASAVARVEVKPFEMVAADGERVTVESISAAVDAPGPQKPATVRASATLAGAGGARAPVTLDAKLSNWASDDGTFSMESLRVDGALAAEKASTRVVGTLLGMGGELAEAVGPDLTVSAKAVSSGPGTASATLRASGRFVTLDAPQLVLRKGLLNVVPEKPVTLDFVPSEPVRRRYLASINPIFRDIRLADEKKPIRFAVESVSYPVDGDLSRLNGDMRLTVGAVLLERNPDNDVLNLLKVFQAKDAKPIDGVIDPLVVQIRKGQLAYKDFSVGIERQGNGWKTRLIFDGDIDLTKQPAFARTIAANYPMASMAREVVGLLPTEDGGGSVANVLNTLSLGVGDALQLRIRFRGPLGEVDGKPAKLERKVKVVFDSKEMTKDIGKTVENIGGAIGDLFKKKGK